MTKFTILIMHYMVNIDDEVYILIMHYMLNIDGEDYYFNYALYGKHWWRSLHFYALY